NRLDEIIGIERIYNIEDSYWQDFYYSITILKWVIHTAHKHGGGRPPKIVIDLDIDRIEFCKDLNKCLEYGRAHQTDYLKDGLINSYKLSNQLLDGDTLLGNKYGGIANPDPEGLNKFIKSIFELEWPKHEGLLPIFRFSSEYHLYLPKN